MFLSRASRRDQDRKITEDNDQIGGKEAGYARGENLFNKQPEVQPVNQEERKRKSVRDDHPGNAAEDQEDSHAPQNSTRKRLSLFLSSSPLSQGRHGAFA
jgi:hypothetical protein